MDAPPVNAFTQEFVDELDEAVTEAEVAEPPVVVVESALDGVFSAGGDLAWYAEIDDATMRSYMRHLHEVTRRIETLPSVVVAAIDGNCLGGGFELALACDLRFVSDGDWELGCVESELGAIPGGGGTQRLPRAVGRGPALMLLLEARRLSPATAREMDLVQKVLPRAEFEEEVDAWTRDVASGPSRAHVAAKQAVLAGTERPIDEGLACERRLEGDLIETADFAEGLAAFHEGRTPEFEGR